MQRGTKVKTVTPMRVNFPHDRIIAPGTLGEVTASFGTDGSWYVWIRGTEYTMHPDQIEEV